MLAGFGYAIAGVKAPLLLEQLPHCWPWFPWEQHWYGSPLGISLILTDQLWPGIGLLLWVFWWLATVDNVIRPLVISGASRVPFLVVLFVYLGAYGLRCGWPFFRTGDSGCPACPCGRHG